MAGGALAIFVSELAREIERPAEKPFPDAWFREASRPLEHLWAGEPTFDWGD
jgi:hypothetical protein